MSWLLMAVCLWLTACNDNDEPKNDVELAINEQFQPCSVTVSRSDSAFTEMCERWGNRTVVVNSVVDESLNWLIIMGVGGDIADVDKIFCFTRFAILVPKLTDSSSLKIWLSVQSLSGLNK
jgi:hypothetical protein